MPRRHTVAIAESGVRPMKLRADPQVSFLIPEQLLRSPALNFYRRNLGDYARDTKHLTFVEHGAYNMLLDLLYATEKPLPLDTNLSAKLIGSRSAAETRVMVKILEEYFIKTRRGWTHKRYIEELKYMKSMVSRTRENGKKGGRPKTQRVLFDNPEITQPVNSQNPPDTKLLQTLDSRLQTPENSKSTSKP